MKVLVIGSGGREHALAWKVRQSPLVERFFCAPWNGGTAEGGLAENVDIRADDLRELYRFAKQNRVDLTIVGPEGPLAAGIVDLFEDGGLRCFGPKKEAAKLEASKVFAKNLMRKHVIPTADYKIFSKPDEAKQYLRQAYYPLVVKADGLAQGKGVFICADANEATRAVDRIMVDRELGDEAGAKIIDEDALRGEEASVHALTDSVAILVLEDAHDYQRAEDRDRGPNTGGMGAYSPYGVTRDPALMRAVEPKILVAAVHAMKREDHPFTGLLYAGIMLTATGPKVLEYNVRLGDPEAQVILARLRSDLVPLLLAATDRTREQAAADDVVWDERASVCVVLASAGYPGPSKVGFPIHGLDRVRALFPDVLVFHAGTRREREPSQAGESRAVTAGGRVLGIVAYGDTVAAARARAYEAVREVRFEGMRYRRDIGADVPSRQSTVDSRQSKGESTVDSR